RADDHGERAVFVQATDCTRGLGRAGPAAEGHADALAGPLLVAVAPGRMVAQRLQHLARADARPWLAVGHRVTLDDGVLEPELQRVQPQLPRQLVHLPLDGKARLRRTGGAIGPGARL